MLIGEKKMDSKCNRHCKHCLEKLCTRSIPIFAALERDQLEKIAGLTAHVTFEKGSVIIEENTVPDFVAIINSGSVKAIKYTPEGREQILYLFSEGDFFGEQNLLFSRPAFYNIVALEQVNLCLLYKQDFNKLLSENSDISMKIIGELGWRLAHMENAVQNMGVRSLEARISAVLLELSDKYGSDSPEGRLLNMPLSREGFANYIGIARETVSRKLGQLENDRIIQSIGNKTILIKNKEMLEEIAGLT